MNRPALAAALSVSLALTAGFGVRAQQPMPTEQAPATAQPLPPPPAPESKTGAPAAIAEPGAGQQMLIACKADIDTYCGTAARGRGRKFRCLKDNEAKLAPACQASIRAVLDKHDALQNGAAGPVGKPGSACAADVASFCAGVERGGGAIAKCLKENATKVSTACRTELIERQAKMEASRQNVRAICAADIVKLCGAANKPKDVMQCLREKSAQTTPECRQALTALPASRAGKGRKGGGL